MSSESNSINVPKSNKRLFHWVVAEAFFTLLLTGLPLLVPGLSGLASDSWTRLIHRVAAVIFMGTPLIYALTHRSAARQWLMEAAFWKPTTSYNPDTWKRRHKSLVTISFILFVLTGMIQWFLKDVVPSAVFQFSIMIHDVVLYFSIVVLLYHVYHEFDWWLWKRRHCRTCDLVYCVDACPVRALVRTPNGTVDYYRQRCNNCRQCLESCRGQHYYKKIPDAELADAMGNRERSETAAT